ncbi:MAG: hypothetical protein LUE29_00410 [Lachnospiraceae bacterium]|nr:hypothetical protein [Lachnospiraceae bacterium]
MMKLYDEEEILTDFIASERREERERFEKKRLSDLLQMIQNVMVNLNIDAATALDALGISEQDRRLLAPLL